MFSTTPLLTRLTALVFIVSFLLPSPAHSSESSVFYLRSDVKIVNGYESENELLMIPSEEDFRATSFNPYHIHGTSLLSAQPDAISAAKHDAFKRLLRDYGIQSIQGKSKSEKNQVHDETIMSFEGFIRTPYTILDQKIDKTTHTLHVELEVSFAPMAYPQDWWFEYYKKKLYDTLKNMISVFL